MESLKKKQSQDYLYMYKYIVRVVGTPTVVKKFHVLLVRLLSFHEFHIIVKNPRSQAESGAEGFS